MEPADYANGVFKYAHASVDDNDAWCIITYHSVEFEKPLSILHPGDRAEIDFDVTKGVFMIYEPGRARMLAMIPAIALVCPELHVDRRGDYVETEIARCKHEPELLERFRAIDLYHAHATD